MYSSIVATQVDLYHYKKYVVFQQTLSYITDLIVITTSLNNNHEVHSSLSAKFPRCTNYNLRP